MAADITIKTFDLFPPLVTVLYDTTLGTPGKAIDLATATAVKMIWKGTATPVKTGAMTKLSVVTPTATTTLGSNLLTAVSAFTSIVKGSGVIGAGIPLGAIVGDFDTTLNTITLTDNAGNALNATAGASNVTLTVNKGTVQYQWVAGDTSAVDTYSVEFEITWPTGLPQTVPNASYRTMTILADLEGA